MISFGELAALVAGAELPDQVEAGKVPDDRRFVLQVVVQPQAAVREVLAYDRHLEVARVGATDLGGQVAAEETGLVGATSHLREQFVPFGAGEAAGFEVGARPFASMVEEAFVVVLRLQGCDLGVDEVVDVVEQLLHVVRKIGSHAWSSNTKSNERMFRVTVATSGVIFNDFAADELCEDCRFRLTVQRP